MRWNKTVTVIGAHAEGEVGRVLTGGVLNVPGNTTLEKMQYLQSNDELRQFVNREPRGCAQMTTNLLLPASAPEADAAFIPMQADGTHAMSGSNAMCVTTVLLETGMLPMQEPVTSVVLDSAAGLVKAKAQCKDGRVERVTLDFFPAFAEHLDVPLEVEGIGTLTVDVAFGGVYYVLPRVQELGFRIGPDVAQDMVSLGAQIKSAAQQQLAVRHPEVSAFDSIEFLMFTDDVDPKQSIFRNATIMPPGRVDRSPCGTGSAARLAVMHAKGQAQIGQEFEMRSTINSKFSASVLGTTTVGSRPAILPRLSGRAWIYATMQLGADPSDPFQLGYTLADTWGTEIEHIIPGC
ncbi:proline racemase (plasmid) [Parasedimentitalea marina]|uniref:Proline racemase n=1 Tax=Parasedimentitalea marina TaxID=2483033 RepID=A0A3T0N9P2_9RHOB|nr:proline racemase family protein [Parasedimentitalea marina]AZV80737.1 proline racemase [Parasedimentitalea marina]